MARSHEHLVGYSHSSHASRVYRVSLIDCTTAQIEMARKQYGKLQRYNSIYTAIYIYLNIYHLPVYLRLQCRKCFLEILRASNQVG